MANPHHWHCKVCGETADNRVCRSCYERLSAPCPDCGAITPTITRMGRPAAPKCVACMARDNADTRRIGRTCKVCGVRSPDVASFYQVCPDCLAIAAPCTVCGAAMPKYRKKGLLRAACSDHCRITLMQGTPEERSKRSKQGQRTRFANHIYRSHENAIARGKAEYGEWRGAVFARDAFICQDCGARNQRGNGETVALHPHHVKPFATYPDLRYDVANGVTLCASCHRHRHQHTFIGRTRRRVRGQLRLPIAG